MTEGLSHNQFIPSVIISLDDNARQIIQQVQRIYNRRQVPQKRVMEFLHLKWDDKQPTFIPQNELVGNVDIAEDPKKQNRTDLLSKFYSSLPNIKNNLDEKTRAVFDHNRLIEAGFELEKDIPLNLFLVADTKEIVSSTLLLPVVLLLNDIAVRHQIAKVHLLLNVASFPDSQPDEDLNVFSALNDLVNVFENKREAKNHLCKNLKIEDQLLSLVTIYILHNRKEGSGYVVDNKQMNIMIGNGLLALMMDDAARKFARVTSDSRIYGEDIVFNSIGATEVIYDPESLQLYAAQKATIETLDNVILANPMEGVATAEAGKLGSKIGDFQSWTAELLKNHPKTISQFILDQETKFYDATFNDMELEPIQFVEFSSLEWKDHINDLEQKMNDDVLPVCFEAIDNNGNSLLNYINEEIKEFAIGLPQSISCYPGGIKTSLLALEKLKEDLISRREGIRKFNQQLAISMRRSHAKLKRAKQVIDKLVDDVPLLPHYFDKIPEKYQEISAAIYYHVMDLIPVILLRWYRRKVSTMIHTLASRRIQINANNQNLDLIDQVCNDTGVIKEWQDKLNKLMVWLQNHQIKLKNSKHNSPASEEVNGWTPNFRISAVSDSLAEAIYARHEKNDEIISTGLIIDHKLFNNWSEDLQTIGTILSEFHQELFEDVWNLNLMDIHQFYSDYDLKEEDPLRPEYISTYLQTCNPLLNPQTETGEMKGAYLGHYYLIGDNQWTEFSIPEPIKELMDPEKIWTDDKYSLIAAQVWHNINYGALAPIFEDVKRKYDKLSEDNENLSEIFKKNDFVTTIHEDEETITRDYQWEFTPKDTSDSYILNLKLEISVQRYKAFCAKPRDKQIQEYNYYAQADIPEVDAIVLEFQKIFAQQKKWSTYNKALCVLRFVQTAVTYRHDNETKGQAEWPRYPIETLVEGMGDCEDVAILCASIMARLGFDTVLFYYINTPEVGHMAFGVAGSKNMKGNYIHDPATGKRYYYGESTSKGWMLGEIPNDYRRSPEKIIKVEILVDENGSTED